MRSGLGVGGWGLGVGGWGRGRGSRTFSGSGFGRLRNSHQLDDVDACVLRALPDSSCQTTTMHACMGHRADHVWGAYAWARYASDLYRRQSRWSGRLARSGLQTACWRCGCGCRGCRPHAPSSTPRLTGSVWGSFECHATPSGAPTRPGGRGLGSGLGLGSGTGTGTGSGLEWVTVVVVVVVVARARVRARVRVSRTTLRRSSFCSCMPRCGQPFHRVLMRCALRCIVHWPRR